MRRKTDTLTPEILRAIRAQALQPPPKLEVASSYASTPKGGPVDVKVTITKSNGAVPKYFADITVNGNVNATARDFRVRGLELTEKDGTLVGSGSGDSFGLVNIKLIGQRATGSYWDAGTEETYGFALSPTA